MTVFTCFMWYNLIFYSCDGMVRVILFLFQMLRALSAKTRWGSELYAYAYAHARPRVFPYKVFFRFLALLLHNAIQTTDRQRVKCEGLSFTSPSPVLHIGRNYPKRIRLRVFFRTVTDSILHFVNFFSHGYGDARCRTGIYFCTVAVSATGFLYEFFDNTKINGVFSGLSDRLESCDG